MFKSKKPRIYKTVQGDTWDIICFKKLNNEFNMHQLMELNFYLRTVRVFKADVEVRLPLQSDLPVNTDHLPPWKK